MTTVALATIRTLLFYRLTRPIHTADSQGRKLRSFYMKYAPAEDGSFDGQRGYGYISFEKFIDAV